MFIVVHTSAILLEKLLRRTLFVTLSLWFAVVAALQPALAADFVDTAAINQAGLAPGWSGQAFVYNDDVWIRSYYNGVGQFDYQIGEGGTVAEMRAVQAGYKQILAPWPLPADRVIQSTWWDFDLYIPWTANPTFTQDYDRRFNLTQGGGNAGLLTPTVSVHLSNTPVPQVDVYSTPQDQFIPEDRPYFRAKASYLTRYRLIGEGNLMIRRVMLIGDVFAQQIVPGTESCDYDYGSWCYASYQEAQVSHASLYVEAWTPLKIANSNPGFTGLALALNPDGSPAWYYHTGWNIPTYPQFPAPSTNGYAVAYNRTTAQWSTAVGMVFGTQQPATYSQNVGAPYGAHVLNSLEQGGTLAILPALYLGNPESGSVIDQYFVMVPRQGLDYMMYVNLQQMLGLVPAPRFFHANTVFEGELASIVNKIKTNMTSNVGVRTGHLAPLIQ